MKEDRDPSFEDYIVPAQSCDFDLALIALRKIRLLLLCSTSADDAIKAGIVPVLVKCLKSSMASIQEEAAWTIVNIVGGTEEQTKAVVRVGAIPLLINLLKSNDSKVRDHCVWALANIVGTGTYYRDFCIQSGIIQPLLRLAASETNLLMLQNIAWVFCNICRQTDFPISNGNVCVMVPALKRMLDYDNEGINKYILQSFYGLAYGENNHIQILLDNHIFEAIVGFLNNTDPIIYTNTFEIFNIMAYDGDEHLQHILDCGVLQQMRKLLVVETNLDTVKRSVTFFISNVAAGSFTQIQKLFDENLISLIVGLFNDSNNTELHGHILYTVMNLTCNGTEEQISLLIDLNFIPSLATNRRKEVCELIMESRGDDKIKELANHSNPQIKQLSENLLASYLFFKDDTN
uniref:Importin subunit alpha n=1 Tax=Panagrolaimus sp. ES5 TaxID=591445 RepID=A0AC34FZD2_9BILA